MGAATVLAIGVAGQAHAGLSLEEALDRHRVLGEPANGVAADFAVLPPPADGLTLGVGGPTRETPFLMRPTLRGRGGARVVWTPVAPEHGRGPVVRLGLNAHEHARIEDVLEGSVLSMPLGVGEVYASVETRHWGPGWAGSLILDAGAPALPAIGWRKTQPTSFEPSFLSWLGPWNADFFVSQLAGHTTPARPYLIGMRFQVRPLPGLEIGASRAIQWGGRGRNQSAKSLLNAIVGRDNSETDNEPGNQLGGFDVRYARHWGDGGEWAIYGQGVGEDEAGMLPSQWTGLLGAEIAGRWQGRHWRVYAEQADLVAGRITGDPHYGSTYRHDIYQQGYTQRGLPLGHAAGGDVRLTSVGALVDAGALSFMVSAHKGKASPHPQRFLPDAELHGVNGAVSLDIGSAQRVGVGLWHWRAGADRSRAVQAWWQTAWR